MKNRIIGFDLARAYAIFGMYIVNFNIVFGNYNDSSLLGKFLALFSGNSSTVFVMLAGMGVALMTNRPHYSPEEQQRLRTIIHKRALFLFVIGLMLYTWWPADILHFYGGYMHIAALLLFVDKRHYLSVAALAIILFHALMLVIPYETGWNFTTLEYKDFWTVSGFLRNTLYNGWNPILPWLSYFTVGMYLGRLDWTQPKTQRKMFSLGAALYLIVVLVQSVANHVAVAEDMRFFLTADYIPPFLPFILSTMGFGLMLISAFMVGSKYWETSTFAHNLAKTGQMTLTHYISHLTIGIVIFALVTGKKFEGTMNTQAPVHPAFILLFAIVYYLLSYSFSTLWTRKYNNGPFEMLMRKLSD